MSTQKILLVDDNKGQRITLESILKHSGFHVITADCGNAALRAASEFNFAAALVDIKMPDLTGIEVLRELKANKPEMYVIMMTGYSETETAIDALERQRNVAEAVAKGRIALQEFTALEEDYNSVLNHFLRVVNGAVVASR